jgi:hypothetical protein
MDRSVPVVAERATVPKLPKGRREGRRRRRIRRREEEEEERICKSATIYVHVHKLIPRDFW